MTQRLLWIGFFGLLGVFSRYGVMAVGNRWITQFPAGTLLVNAVGSFLAGVVFVAGSERGLLTESIRIGLLAGFLGGFTTFSAVSLESAKLLLEGPPFTGILYLMGSPIAGLLSTLLGIWLARAGLAGA